MLYVQFGMRRAEHSELLLWSSNITSLEAQSIFLFHDTDKDHHLQVTRSGKRSVLLVKTYISPCQYEATDPSFWIAGGEGDAIGSCWDFLCAWQGLGC